MRLYSMTATFGKLEHQTLTLSPGLNIIEASNEWGKSTWCAFLAAMLYGIETRSHSTKNALAVKERYAPWSGAPMSGRMDLSWNGRDITIERKTRGRAIFGDFRAYETATGISIPELTAANCGQQLLGVEREVFLRAGFIRQENMPVTADDALRRRLNALVTTGDESDTAGILEKKLKELKNRCRFHKTGLLPQAQAQAEALEQRLSQLTQAQQQLSILTDQQIRLKQACARLANHQKALSYAAAQKNRERIAAVESEYRHAQQQVSQLEGKCASLPPQAQATQDLERLNHLQQTLASLQMASPALPDTSPPPTVPAPFVGMTPEQALAQARSDSQRFHALTGKQKPGFPLWLIGLLLLALGAGLLICSLPIPGYIALGIGGGVTLLSVVILLRRYSRRKQNSLQANAIREKYGSLLPEQWEKLAVDHLQAVAAHEAELQQRKNAYSLWNTQISALQTELNALTNGAPLSQYSLKLQEALACYADLGSTRQTLSRLENTLDSLQHLPTQAAAPEFPDSLTHSPEETAALLSEDLDRQHRLQQQLGHCLGQMEQLGQESDLRSQLDTLYCRIRSLEDTYAALTLAQQTLSDATMELQRRFAPQITKRTQQLFSRMTGGRYDRLTLTEDFGIHAAAVQEDTLHSVQWRSEGTVDQLYLSLRLAVSEALTPQAPLVLDDALVRFDDKRLAAAMEILQEEAAQKQVILFTCQHRENTILHKNG